MISENSKDNIMEVLENQLGRFNSCVCSKKVLSGTLEVIMKEWLTVEELEGIVDLVIKKMEDKEIRKEFLKKIFINAAKNAMNSSILKTKDGNNLKNVTRIDLIKCGLNV